MKFAYLTRKFKKFLRNNKKLLDKYKHNSSKNKKREKSDTRDAKKRSHFVRCHKYEGYVYVKYKCPSYEKIIDKSMNVTLIDNESNFDNQNESAWVTLNEMVFASVVKSKLVEKNERDEDKEQYYFSPEESKDDRKIYDAFNELYEECLKINEKRKS